MLGVGTLLAGREEEVGRGGSAAAGAVSKGKGAGVLREPARGAGIAQSCTVSQRHETRPEHPVQTAPRSNCAEAAQPNGGGWGPGFGARLDMRRVGREVGSLCMAVCGQAAGAGLAGLLLEKIDACMHGLHTERQPFRGMKLHARSLTYLFACLRSFCAWPSAHRARSAPASRTAAPVRNTTVVVAPSYSPFGFGGFGFGWGMGMGHGVPVVGPVFGGLFQLLFLGLFLGFFFSVIRAFGAMRGDKKPSSKEGDQWGNL
eukprot:132735-Chlamydomonas_euryale.AAC.11